MYTNQRGSTLMSVTWMLAITGIIATFLIYRSETEWLVIVNAEKSQGLHEVAEQTLYEHLAVLLKDETENDHPKEEWFGENGRFVSEKDGYQITVLIEDEGSKPNLNLMTEVALLNLVKPQDLSATSLNTATPPDLSATPSTAPPELSVAPILDWLDPDQNERENGAEAPYYQSLNPAYKPRDGFFSSLQELLQVKDGQELYAYLAPELTVQGKINFNTLTTDQFAFILKSAGFDDLLISNIMAEFQKKMIAAKGTANYQRVNAIETLSRWATLDLLKCKKLLPFLQFTGSSNVNMMSLKGLQTLLIFATQGFISGIKARNLAQKILDFCHQSQPLESFQELQTLLGNEVAKKFTVEDYFTFSSSIIRYRIWVSKGGHSCFLNTVQKRVPGDLRVKWQIRTLSWQFLTNKSVPEIPEMTSFEEVLNPTPMSTSTPDEF
jgi:type II secretory pathway component PulK